MIEYSAPIALVYSECVDRLLINIARHFNVTATGNTGSFDWQTQKLAEMGRLNAESRRIIADAVGGANTLAELALESSLQDAMAKMDKPLSKAAKRGLVTGYTGEISPKLRYIFRMYYEQATADINLVNTVMLTDSDNQMRRVISSIAQSQTYLRDVTQGVLNTMTGEVVTGITSHQQSVRQAMQQLAKDGITGYRDKAGKMWTPDAYLHMDIGTTAGNVAREASFQQAREFAGGLIIWPVNATARPGCAPWQGKVCSVDGQSGYTTDLDGNQIRVYALSETSYGQPAGIGGINCHHTSGVSPFVGGFSTIPEQTKTQEQNIKDYKLSQQQRTLENKVKLQRRAAVLYDTTGDAPAFAEASLKARKAQADLKAFCESTGRTYRSDRLQVYGYDRSVSGKVIASNRSKETPVLTPRQSAAKQTATPAPIKRRAQLDPYKDKATAKTLLQAETGMAEADASKVMQDFDAYFTNDYAKFVNGEKPEAVARIDKALSKMAPYDGEIYRGIHLVPRELDSLLDAAAPGAEIRMKSVSSWTSNRGVADEFAGKNFSGATETVVFSCKKNLTSVGVRHLSSCAKNEDEVLALSTSKWRVIDVKKTEQTYVRFGVTEPKMTYDNRVNGYVQAYDTVIELEEIL